MATFLTFLSYAMPTENKLLDDIAKVAGGAVSLISTVRQQVKSDLRGKMESLVGRADIAPQSEMDRLLAMVAKLRAEQEALKARIEALENSSGKSSLVKKKTEKTVAKAIKKPTKTKKKS